MVGAAGFEPATLGSQNRCATGLRYAPNVATRIAIHMKVQQERKQHALYSMV